MVGNKLATLGRFLIPKLVTRKMAFLADDKSESESECVFFVRPEKDLGCGSGVGAAAPIGMLARTRTMNGNGRIKGCT